MTKKIANFILFQIGWFACVMGGDLVAIVLGSSILAIHLIWIARDSQELKLIAFGALVGIIADQLLILFGILIVPEHSLLIPCWLIFLWLIFMTCINHSLSWVKKYPWLGAVSGAIFAPLSYYGGVRLGALEFGMGWYSLITIGAVWALSMMLIANLAIRFEHTPKNVVASS